MMIVRIPEKSDGYFHSILLEKDQEFLTWMG